MKRSALYPIFYFARRYPLRAAAVMVSLIIAGGSEGLGILALLPLLQFIIKGDTIPQDSKVNAVFNSIFDTAGIEVNLFNTLLFLVVFITVKSLARLLAMYIVSASAAAITADFQSRLIRALTMARWSYFTGKPAGHLSTAANSEASLAANCIVKQASFLAEALQICIYLAIALFVSWWVTLGAAAVGGIGHFMLKRVFKRARQAGEDQTLHQKALMANILDGVRIMKPVRAMGREDYLQPFIQENIRKLTSAYKWLLYSPFMIGECNEIIKTVSLAAGLMLLMNTWQGDPERLLLLGVLFLRVLQKLGAVQKSYIVLTAQIPSFWYMLDTIQEAENARETWQGVKKAVFQSNIEFRNVRYGHDGRSVLDGASFILPRRSFSMIAGPSGAGKSTLIDLLCGLYRPVEGNILIDGTDLRDIDIRDWRARIGYVPQDALLLNDTVYNNVALYDREIGEARVLAALAQAGADFALADLHASVGEGGGRLSGGQKQRIVLARALVRSPQLLILDEATSGLDAETERTIFERLKALSRDLALVVVTHNHRLQSYADRVLVMQEGSVKEMS